MPNVYLVANTIIPFKPGPLRKQERYAMVQEKDSGLWNHPGGEFDFTDKELINVATRESYEECGLTVAIQGLIGLYSFQSKQGNRILCASFLGKYVEGDLRTNSPDITDVRDMSLSEIRELGRSGKLRSDNTIKSVEDYLRRGIYPINEIFHFLG